MAKHLKKALAMILTVVMLFTTLPIVATATSADLFKVGVSSPAIPMNVGTVVSLSDLEIQMTDDADSYITGDKLAWTYVSGDAVLDSNAKTITALSKGNTKLKVSNGSVSRYVWVVAKNKDDTDFALVDYDFSTDSFDYKEWNLIHYTDSVSTPLSSDPSVNPGVIQFEAGSGVILAPNNSVQEGYNWTIHGVLLNNNDIFNYFSDYTVETTLKGYKDSSPDWTGFGTLGRVRLTSSGGFDSNYPNIISVQMGLGGVSLRSAGLSWWGSAVYTCDSSVISRNGTADKPYYTQDGLDHTIKTVYSGADFVFYLDGIEEFNLSKASSTIQSNFQKAENYAVHSGYPGIIAWGPKTTFKKFSVKLNSNDMPRSTEYKVYTVSDSSPAIPMNTNTVVKFKDISVVFGETEVLGSEINFTLKNTQTTGVVLDNTGITAYQKGVYPVTAKTKDNSSEKTVYIVVKDASEERWTLYSETFDDYSDIEVNSAAFPQNWKSQVYSNHSWHQKDGVTSFGNFIDFNFITPYTGTKEITTVGPGIVPFYNTTYDSSNDLYGYASPAFFILNDATVNAFADYTIESKMIISANNFHNQGSNDSATGGGLFGRANILSSGKLDPSSTDFRGFVVDPSGNGDSANANKVRLVDMSLAAEKKTTSATALTNNLGSTKFSYMASYNRSETTLAVKYDGQTATFYAPGDNTKTTYSATVPVQSGAVGVMAYMISDGGAASWVNVRDFCVYLNNEANDCPKAEKVSAYYVSSASPAIPMNTYTKVELKDLAFEFENSEVSGSDVTLSLVNTSDENSISVSETAITAYSKGTFPIKVTSKNDNKTITVYVVVKDSTDTEWTLYSETFTENSIPSNWKAQYVRDNAAEFRDITEGKVVTSNTFSNEFTDGELTAEKSGVVPFYRSDSTGWYSRGYMILNDVVVSKFKNYKITADMYSYGHNYGGGGLVGRVQNGTDGKLNASSSLIGVYNTQGSGDGNKGYPVSFTMTNGTISSVRADAAWNYAIHSIAFQTYSLEFNDDQATFSTPALTDLDYTFKVEGSAGDVGVMTVCTYDGDGISSWLKLHKFTVTLNNKANDCPKASALEIYRVTDAAPAIPMNSYTTIQLKDICFEFGKETVLGTDAVFTFADNSAKENVIIDDTALTVYSKGTYSVTVSTADALKSRIVYIVVKNPEDEKWVIYSESFGDFTGVTNFPNNWTAQVYASNTYTDITTVAPYNANIGPHTNAPGLVPFTNLGSSYYWSTAYLTLNDEIVNQFGDYTVSAKFVAYSHYNTTSGSGLFARAGIDENGKLYKDNNSFVGLAANSKPDNLGVFTVASNTQTTSWLGKSETENGWDYLKSKNGKDQEISVKYSGTTATLFSDKDSESKEFIASVPSGKGAVGVLTRMIGDGGQVSWVNVREFSVYLNNAADDCPRATKAQSVYVIPAASPAIPFEVNTKINLKTIGIVIGGEFVFGDEIKWSANDDSIVIENTAISVYKEGVFKLTAEYGDDQATVYAVIEDSFDASRGVFKIYSSNFENGVLGGDWNINYAVAANNSYLSDTSGKNYRDDTAAFKFLKSGVTPFTNNIVGTQSATAFMFVKNDILNAFSDYTVNAKMNINAGLTGGAGLLGRLDCENSSLLDNNSEYFAISEIAGGGLQNVKHSASGTGVYSQTARVSKKLGDLSFLEYKAGSSIVQTKNYSLKFNKNMAYFSEESGTEVFSGTASVGVGGVGIIAGPILADGTTNVNVLDFSVTLNEEHLNILPESTPISTVSGDNGINVNTLSILDLRLVSVTVGETTVSGKDIIWADSKTQNYEVDADNFEFIAYTSGSYTLSGTYNNASVNLKINASRNPSEAVRSLPVVEITGEGSVSVLPQTGSDKYTVTLTPCDGYKLKTLSLKNADKVLYQNSSSDGLSFEFELTDISELALTVEFITDNSQFNTAMLGATFNASKCGIRFGARTDAIKRNMQNTSFGKLENSITVDGTEYQIAAVGQIMIPSALLNGEELTVSTDKVISKEISSIVNLTDNYSDFALTLINIPSTMFSTDISSRAYVKYKINDETYGYVYSDTISRSYLGVANAYNAGLNETNGSITADATLTDEIIENVAYSVASESAVLLKNNSSALPLVSQDKVAAFGIDNGSSIYTALSVFSQNGKFTLYNTSSTDVSSAKANGVNTAVYFIEKSDWELTITEKELLLSLKDNFDKVIVVVGADNRFESSWIKDGIEGVTVADAVLLIQSGFENIAKPLAALLSGDKTPSGKLTYTLAKTKADYDNADSDIFGYQQFEVNDPEYTKVNFEFGFGLSYTNFRTDNITLGTDGTNIIVTAKVTNTGSFSGKETIQVYFSAPSSENGTAVINSSSKVLAGFAKTKTLSAGESQTLTVKFPISDMVSTAGNYQIFVGNSVKSAESIGTYNVKTAPSSAVSDVVAIPVATDTSDSGFTFKNGTIMFDDVVSGKYTVNEFLAQLSNAELLSFMLSGKDDQLLDQNLIGANGSLSDKYGVAFAHISRFDEIAEETLGLPSGISLLRTWNVDLQADYATVVGKTIAMKDNLNFALSPSAALMMEYKSEDTAFSEDGYLLGKLIKEFVSKVQSFCVPVIVEGLLDNYSEESLQTLLKPLAVALNGAEPSALLMSNITQSDATAIRGDLNFGGALMSASSNLTNGTVNSFVNKYIGVSDITISDNSENSIGREIMEENTKYIINSLLDTEIQEGVFATQLKIDDMTDPMGIDYKTPQFGWKMHSSIRGDKQTAYRIGVASSVDLARSGNFDIWDSGKIVSDKNTAVYGEVSGEGATDAAELTAQTEYYWIVQIYNKDGVIAVPASVAKFETGLFGDFGTENKWIAAEDPESDEADITQASSLFRKQFTLSKPVSEVAKARLYSTAAGSQNMYMNGVRAGDDYFAPGKSEYTTYVYYQTYDVTSLIQEGDNTVAAEVGYGWYNAGAVGCYYGLLTGLKAKLVITFTDGTTQVIDTDSSWLGTRQGPTTNNKFYVGQWVDARRNIENWNSNNSTSEKWLEVKATDVFKGITTENREFTFTSNFIGENMEPVRNIMTIHPTSVEKISDNVYVYLFDQNIVGTSRITATASEGTEIIVDYTENYQNKNFNIAPYNTHNGTDKYVFAGDQNGETVEFDLVYHGFQYIRITGLDHELPLDAVEGLVLSSDMDMIGELFTSNADINRYYQNVLWSVRGNFISTLTDCPTREKNTWTGDAQLIAQASSLIMNVRNHYRNFQEMTKTAQYANGAVPFLIPCVQNNNNTTAYQICAAGWTDCIIIIPWQMYNQYGDISFIEDNYTAMKKYMDYMISEKVEGTDPSDPTTYFVRKGGSYGDHLAYYNYIEGEGYEVWDEDFSRQDNKKVWRETSYAEIGTAYAAYTSKLLALMAEKLGNTEDAEYYMDIHSKFAAAWKANFVEADGITCKSGVYGKQGSQTSYAMGICFDLYNEEEKWLAAQKLADRVKEENYIQTVGFIGSNILFPALTMYGQYETALKIMENSNYPSLLYMVNNGATTIWEDYGGGMSRNHYTMGAPASWLTQYVAGINNPVDGTDVGYTHFELTPYYSTDKDTTVTWAKGTLNSAAGLIKSEWKLTNNNKTFTYKCTVPANTTATVSLPVNDGATVLESGADALNAQGVTFVKTENGRNYYNIVSGTYEFTVNN